MQSDGSCSRMASRRVQEPGLRAAEEVWESLTLRYLLLLEDSRMNRALIFGIAIFIAVVAIEIHSLHNVPPVGASRMIRLQIAIDGCLDCRPTYLPPPARCLR